LQTELERFTSAWTRRGSDASSPDKKKSLTTGYDDLNRLQIDYDGRRRNVSELLGRAEREGKKEPHKSGERYDVWQRRRGSGRKGTRVAGGGKRAKPQDE